MIMKKILLPLLLTSIFCFSQNRKEFSLDWTNNYSFVIGDLNYNLPKFQTENFEFDQTNKTVKYTNTFVVEGLVSDSAVSLSNVFYESINASDLGALTASKISSKLDLKTFSSFK